MKRKIIGKVLGCLLCVLSIVLLVIVCIRWVSVEKLDLKEVPVASKDIEPRTKISEKDFVIVQIPGAYVLDNACHSSNEILGKYTDLQGKIPKGSPFYRSMLYEADDLPDNPVLRLEEGEAVFSTTGDAASFSSLTAGLRVDVHGTVNVNNTPLTGKMIEHARILAIKDHQGISLDSKESTGIPYLLEIAVNKEDLDLMTLAEATGTLHFFASSSSYQDEEAVRCDDSQIVQYLLGLQNPEINAENP